MFQTYQYPQYSYRQSEEQQTGTVKRHKVVVIGAGPIGLTAALISPSGASPPLFWMTTTPFPSVRARSVTPNARWRSGTGSAAPRA